MRTLTEPFWLIDNIDVHTWYYRDAPAEGSVIRYANETFIDTVDHVTLTHVWLASGHAMRRPYLTSRLLAWITEQRWNNVAKQRRSSWKPSTQLRPDATLLLV